MTIATRALPTLGAEVLDIDLNLAGDERLRELDDLARRNAVVVVRRQQLSPDALIAFAQRFGNLLPQTAEEQNLPGYPGICVLSNKIVNGRPFGYHKAGRRWHTDGTTLKKPGLTTVLYGIEQRAAMDDIIHPLVLQSPIDGRKTFYLTAGSAKGVVGMTDEAGRALIAEWIAYATQDRFVYRHRWQPGDVLIWNDVCTLHLATDYDDTKYERLVYRCWMTPFS